MLHFYLLVTVAFVWCSTLPNMWAYIMYVRVLVCQASPAQPSTVHGSHCSQSSDFVHCWSCQHQLQPPILFASHCQVCLTAVYRCCAVRLLYLPAEVSNNRLIVASCVVDCRCAGSPIYKVRVMASHALRPVVTADNIGALVESLLSQLPVGGAALSQNRTHGLLLQVCCLFSFVYIVF